MEPSNTPFAFLKKLYFFPSWLLSTVVSVKLTEKEAEDRVAECDLAAHV